MLDRVSKRTKPPGIELKLHDFCHIFVGRDDVVFLNLVYATNQDGNATSITRDENGRIPTCPQYIITLLANV